MNYEKLNTYLLWHGTSKPKASNIEQAKDAQANEFGKLLLKGSIYTKLERKATK